MGGYISVLRKRLDRQNEPTMQFLREDVINLFLPRDKGTTLNPSMIAKRLSISRKRDLEDLEFMLVGLTRDKILYERVTPFISGLYMLNPCHLWKNRTLGREYEKKPMQQPKSSTQQSYLPSSATAPGVIEQAVVDAPAPIAIKTPKQYVPPAGQTRQQTEILPDGLMYGP